MQVKCTKCHTVHKIQDHSISADPIRLKCRRCQHTIVMHADKKSKKPSAHDRKKHRQDTTKPTTQSPKPTYGDQDPERTDLLRRVMEKRDRVRKDRHADRIAGTFFSDDEPKDACTPPDKINKSNDQPAKAVEAAPLEPQRPTTLSLLTTTSQLAKAISRRSRLGIIMISGLIVAVAAGVYLTLTTGLLKISHHPNPAHTTQTRRLTIPVEVQAELTEQEARKIRDVFTVQSQTPERTQKPNPLASITAPQYGPNFSKKDQELLVFYRNDQKEEAAPRAPDTSLLTQAQLDLATPDTSTGLTEPSLPHMHSEVSPRLPVANTNQMTDEQIRMVIQNHKRQIKSCLQRQLKRDASVSGKLYLVAWIKPNGKVHKVSIATPKFKGTFIEECLKQEVKNWRFPTFSGDTYQLRFPLLLTAKDH